MTNDPGLGHYPVLIKTILFNKISVSDFFFVLYKKKNAYCDYWKWD